MPERLKNIMSQEDRKILFAGIGNVLRSDDGAGVYISRRIKSQGNVSSITVETGIENYIGKINSIQPDVLVLIDCADIDSSPGDHRLVRLEEVQDHTFNTHNISLKRLCDFFKMPVFLLCIQPEKVEFGENLSYIVKGKANKIVKEINKKGGPSWL